MESAKTSAEPSAEHSVEIRKAEEKAKAEPSFIIEIGGEKLCLKDYPPITQGDKKAVRKEPYNLDLAKMMEWREDEESLFVLFLLKRVRSHTTLAEVDALPAKLIQDIAGYCTRKSGEIQNPFVSPSSTSSPASTAGGQKS
jgi:hypothetical protein